ILVAALATCGLCLPAKHKPNKLFPKSYGTYDAALAEDLRVPAEHPSLDRLVAPSSYDAYFVQPQDAILPPAGSTYTGVSGTPEEELVAPALDSYSSPDGTPFIGFLPPPVDAIVPEGQESYISYTGEASEGLVAPPVFSYTSTADSQSMGDALAHMIAMVRLLPHSSPYMEYNPALGVVDNMDGPSTMLLPPSAVEQHSSQSSSYSKIPEVAAVPLTPQQEQAALDHDIAIPSVNMLPPAQ
ncbi:unnamed protein product, partial [Meganyctiphanes norvegica]